MPPARPVERHRRPGAGVAACLLALAAASAACAGGEDTGAADAVRQPVLVYLSGLDDHHLHAYDTVPLHREPGGEAIAHAPTDTLAWAHNETGGWLEVTLTGDADLRGWVADYHLRSELHLVDPAAPGCPVPAGDQPGRERAQVDPSTRVRLVDLAERARRTWVLVRDLHSEANWWVERHYLSERAGPDVRRFGPDTPCEDIPAVTPAPHHH
jgi:hypothetical protein